MKKIMPKIKKYLKDNYKQLIFLVLFAIVVNIRLPYYIESPGGTINLTKRLDSNYNKKNGSLNMLYVSERSGNIVTVLLSKVLKNWDLYKEETRQIGDEEVSAIYTRNRIMLENAINNATYAAYKEAGRELKVKEVSNIVIATTKDNGLEVGDNILKVDDITVETITTIQNYLKTLNPGDKVDILIKRKNREITKTITIEEDHLIGIALITNYTYDNPDELPDLLRSGEGGSSGGLILSLGIYSYITGEDILKGRTIAGTGTIDIDGNVGRIDGVKHKLIGAARNNVDIVLIGPDNYDEAKQVIEDNNYKMELVKVNTLREAIDYLSQ